MDNLFFISRKTQDKLLEFKVGGSVKFVNYSHDRTEFLDTMLCRNKDTTNRYTKLLTL